MGVSTARRPIGLGALIVLGASLYCAWELWWALAGLGAFADELGAPPQLSREEVVSTLNGLATARLNRLALIAPAAGACAAMILGLVAIFLRTSDSRDVPQ